MRDGAGNTLIGLSYDVQGNLKLKNGLNHSFDFGNRLREVTGKETYRYDALGRRILASAPGLGVVLSQYAQDGRLVFQSDGRKGLGREYVHLAGSLIARRDYAGADAKITYLHTDALGSPVASTDASGNVIERTHYEPYGAPIGKVVDSPGYTGHVMDGETGLVQMQQRYMDPLLGMFLSVDPVTAHENPVGMFNRYRYAASNPYRFKDPDGRCYTSTGACMTEAEFEQAWKGEPSRVLNTIGSPLGTVADALNGDFKGMIVGAVMSRAPGGKSGVKAAGFFVRFGKGAESAESLAAQAVKAEKAGFPHGVSVKAQERVSAADRLKNRVADQAEAKSAFNTPQTGNNPNHHTVELPKPVTEKVAQKFNEVYK